MLTTDRPVVRPTSDAWHVEWPTFRPFRLAQLRAGYVDGCSRDALSKRQAATVATFRCDQCGTAPVYPWSFVRHPRPGTVEVIAVWICTACDGWGFVE